MPRQASYFLLEAAVALTVLAITIGFFRWRDLTDSTVLKSSAGLILLWLAVDLAAVGLGLWYFPAGGTLPMRVLDLPIEEHMLFGLHTFITLLLVVVLDIHTPE